MLETRAEKSSGQCGPTSREEDLKAVEEAIAKVDETLTAAEKKFTEALERPNRKQRITSLR
ncbi:MAG: hypothetical protein ACLS4Z_00190 [Christensenellaceae bacterium]